MPNLNDENHRQVIPRWRRFSTTTSTGELDSLKPLVQNPFSEAMLADALADWQETPSVSIAADLVSCALTLGQIEVARDAALFVLASETSPDSARRTAECYLADAPQSVKLSLIPPVLGTIDELHQYVHDVRLRLMLYPRNPVYWTNLALGYLTLGLPRKADRAIRVALTLAPHDRFVVRSAARFYFQQSEEEHGLAILRRVPSLGNDPWLLAAEVAIATASNKGSHHAKSATKLIGIGRFAPLHESELASALGTLEAFNGNMKKARQFVRRSLMQPTENAIAQEAWLGRNIAAAAVADPVRAGSVKPQRDNKTISFEANTWSSVRESDWESSLREAKAWQADQPFSQTPAIVGSWLAARALSDYAEAIKMADIGLLSNPSNFAIRNNLAFAYASSDRPSEAISALRGFDSSQLTPRDRLVYVATQGLIAFRSGQSGLGRDLYKRAAIELDRAGDSQASVARIYWALEEIRIDSAIADECREQALAASAASSDPTIIVVREKLRRSGSTVVTEKEPE